MMTPDAISMFDQELHDSLHHAQTLGGRMHPGIFGRAVQVHSTSCWRDKELILATSACVLAAGDCAG